MTDADNSHADRKVAKRAAIVAALAAYEGHGGLVNDRHARNMAAATLALALRTTSERAYVLLADALAERAASRINTTGE